MRRRALQPEDNAGHDRWLVSYADFITLMFALFVVMYSVSTINAGKYRVLSDTLGAVFTDAPEGAPPTSTGELAPAVEIAGDKPIMVVSPSVDSAALAALEAASMEAPLTAADGDASGPATAFGPDELAERFTKALAQSFVPEGARVRRVDDRVEIELDSELLFDAGAARVSARGIEALRALAADLKTAGTVRVEGHTDDRPIASVQFPSNWELSAGRAASVASLLAGFGVEPALLSATGYGAHRPEADNGTADGRARNRRVLLVVGGAASAAGAATPAATVRAGAAGAALERLDAWPAKEGLQP